MGNLTSFYDPNAEIPTAGGALPAGWYMAVIIESELRDNYNKDGEEFSFTYEVIDGKFKGRKFWHTVACTGADAGRIGRGQGEVKAMTAACGIKGAPGDTSNLHYKPHMVRLSFVAAGTVSGSGRAYQKDKNFVNEWREADPAELLRVQPGSTAQHAAANQAQSGASSAPPWANRAA